MMETTVQVRWTTPCMLVINLFGGPGVGKSTLAAQVYAELSKLGYNTEYVGEFAKDVIWSDCQGLLQDQLLVAANQNHRIMRLDGKVDIVVTDSPSLLGVVYRNFWKDDRYSSLLDTLIWELHNKYSRLNFVIPRCHQFVKDGRVHDEQESVAIDQAILDLVKRDYYVQLLPNEDWADTVVKYVTNKI